MKPYDRAQKDCIYGSFDLDKKAGYILNKGDKLKGPWYYVYCNRKTLLYVDQNGPVKIQHQPPNGILPIKREMGEAQSKWQVWICSKELNNGVVQQQIDKSNQPRKRNDA